ncbi:ATPase [Aureococcus anophagefferens]|nr:ATPase [Aureococcus anophagefferens]
MAATYDEAGDRQFWGGCRGYFRLYGASWIPPLARRGMATPVERDDLPPYLPEFDSAPEGLSQMLMSLNTQLFSLRSLQVASTLVARRAATLKAAGAALVAPDERAPNAKRGAKGGSSEANLVGSDLVSIVEMCRFLVFMPASLVAIVGGCVMLFTRLGFVPTVCTMVLVLFTNTRLARVTKRAQKVNLGFADQRLELINEALRGIRSFKLFGWEPGFESRVAAVRDKECAAIFRFRCSQVVSVSLGRASPALASCVAFMACFYSGEGDLDYASVFAALSVFQALRVSMIMLPQTYMYILVMKTRPSSSPKTDTPALEDVTLCVRPGEVVAVVGAVGAGKTCLLAAATGGVLSRTKGSRALGGSVAIAPQKALVFSATVRANVLLSRPFDRSRYEACVDACGLRADFDLWQPAGDLTEVGERGVTLSGGQQARVSLCRALYARPDLLVADDPLSAPTPAPRDAEAAFRRYASPERGVLLALNQMHLAAKCDRVVVVVGGRVVEQGPPGELAAAAALPTPVEEVDLSPPLRKAVELDVAGSDDDLGVAFYKEDDSLIFSARRRWRDGAAAAAAADATRLAAMVGRPSAALSSAAFDGKLTEKEREAKGALVEAEFQRKEAIAGSMYRKYLENFGVARFWFTATVCGASYGCFALGDWSLSRWIGILDVDGEEKREDRLASDRAEDAMWLYGIFVLLSAVLLIATSVLFSAGGVRAAKTLHRDCLHRVLRAPLSYFDATPTGRLTSRFSADLSVVDLQLSFYVDHVFQMSGQILVFAVLIAAVVPPMVAVLAVALAAYGVVVEVADVGLRNAKRLANAAFAPLMTNFSEILASRSISPGSGDEFVEKFFLGRHAIHAHDVAHLRFCTESVPAWANLHATLIAAACAWATALVVLLDGSGPHWDTPATHREPPAELWPSNGSLRFADVTLRYRPGLPPALEHLNLYVEGGTRVGVIGRTGAGKSSLVALVLRLVEPEAGRVLIDGLDVAFVGLCALRKRVSMVPQDNVLLSGSVDRNLDPFEEHGSPDKRRALDAAGLGALALDHVVKADGGSLSAGEKQLLGRVLKDAFVGTTSLTIAHRLETVIDSDMILTMDAGAVAEFDHPANLLDDPDSRLNLLLAALAPDQRAALLARAKPVTHGSL